MLFHLLYPLSDRIAVFNVFRYLTFRTAMAVLTAFLLCALLTPWFIRLLKRLSVGQSIREVGPEAHHGKAGTPTMGGILIVFAVVVPTLLWADLANAYVWLAVGVMLAFGAIGFADDFLMLKRGKNRGLSARAKMMLTVVVGVVAGAIVMSLPEPYNFEPTVAFPFFKHAVYGLGLAYLPFVFFNLINPIVSIVYGFTGFTIEKMEDEGEPEPAVA